MTCVVPKQSSKYKRTVLSPPTRAPFLYSHPMPSAAYCKRPCTNGAIWNLRVVIVFIASISTLPNSASAGSPYVAPPERALLVLLRQRYPGKASKVRVVDAQRGCVAVIGGHKHVLVPLEPGEHTLFLLVARTMRRAQLLELDVSAGNTYLVNLNPRTRKKNFMDPRVISPASPERAEAVEAVRDTRRSTPDLARCAEWLADKSGDDIARKMAFAREEWSDGDDAYRSARTITPGDGFTPEQAATLFD